MGLIKALLQGTRSTLGDQWIDFFYCDTLGNDVLMRKGQKRIAQGSSNTKGSDNIITNGSKIIVNDGQFMLIVDQGKVIDFTAEPGEYVYDKSTEPSLFFGGFGKGLLESFKKVGQRFTMGGDTGHDQRVYFVNGKLITGNKFGTPSPISFRDSEWQRTINITCFGTFVYKIVDPLLFYANFAGNVAYEYRSDLVQSQFKSDLIAALNPALSQVAMQHVAYDMLPGATKLITTAMQSELKANWEDKVGINVDRISIESVSPTEEDAKVIKNLQETRVFQDNSFATAANRKAMAGMIEGMGVGAQKGGSDASPMNGAMNMMGMAMMGNMMGNMPANTPGSMPGMSGNQTDSGQWKCSCGAVSGGNFCHACGQPKPQESANSWKCACGTLNTGKFCMECGKSKPDNGTQNEASPTNVEWKCSCGTINTGKFCAECGQPKPQKKLYQCDKCGWKPADPEHPPKFCPECGDVFDDRDLK